MNLQRLTVKAKLGLAFGSLVALLLVVAAIALVSLGDANARFSHYVGGVNARAILAGHVRQAVDARAVAVRNLVLATAPADAESAHAAVEAAHGTVQTQLAALKKLAAESADASDKAKALVGAIDRIEDKTYGVCQMTGKPIPKARLDAKPWAKYTVEAARLVESGQHR